MTPTQPADSSGRGAAGADPLVDPRAPRFGQGITAVGLLCGLALREPLFVYAIAAILVTAVLTRWRVDAYGGLWRALAIPALGPPTQPEPAAPHRFAQILGAAGTAIASGLLLASGAGPPELAVVGFAIAGAVAALAGLAAATGICVGCRMYRQVAFFRRLNLV